MIVKLLTEHHLEFISLKEAAEARPSLHLSKCHIVGNLMHWFKFLFENGNCDSHHLLLQLLCVLFKKI